MVRIQGFDKLKVSSAKREIKEEGEVIENQVVTTISFECVNVDTEKLAVLIGMISGDIPVDVFFGSPQAIMKLEVEPEKALAR